MAELIFVGTGSGKTSLSRFHSSILVLTSDTNILIDAGDGISKALLSQNIEYNLVERIFITHLHSDHYTGLPSLITQMKMAGRKKDLYVYAEPDLLEVLKGFVLQSYLFADKLGFKINYEPVNQNILYKISDGLRVLSRQNSHLYSVTGFDKTSSMSFSSSSIFISADDKNIHYTSDIDSVVDLHLFDDYKADLLISELTHIRQDDIIELIRSKSHIKRVIFTHISTENEKLKDKFDSNVSPGISTKFLFSYDGLKFTI